MGGEGRVSVPVERGKNIECVVQMHLSGGAYVVYKQLSEEKRTDFACIKDKLYTAFVLNPMTAYKQFAVHFLHPGEIVDVFLAKLRKLATQFGDMMEQGLVCAFIAGLLEHAEKRLQATTRVDDLPISEILARAWEILKDSFTGTGLAAAAAQLPGCQQKETTALRRCFICQGPYYIARDCPRRCESPGPPKSLICYRCKRQGHIAWNCPGNEQGPSLQCQSLPQTSSERRAPCDHCAHWQSKAYCSCGYRLDTNPSTQVMLSDVEEKASPLASCWREFVYILWRECGPNWYRQWTLCRHTSSGCGWGSAWIWSANWAECDQTTRWNSYVWHRRSEISLA